MKGKKPARNLGGRPTEREPELGKRTHLTIALTLPLKRRIEQEAAKQGRSVSSEAAYRLEQSFSQQALLKTIRSTLFTPLGPETEGSRPPRKPVRED